MRPDAQNLQAIDKALKQHESTCGEPVLAIEMNPFEVERLGWEHYQGIPIRGNDKLPTGILRLVCNGEHDRSSDDRSGASVGEERRELVEAVGHDAPHLDPAI